MWPVTKLALAFHLACAVVTMGALVVVWLVGRKLGTVDRVAKFLEDVGFARDFEIQGPVLFRWATAVAGVLVLVNTVGTVVLAFLYNSLSGLLGGLVFSVLEEQSPPRPATTRRDRRRPAAEGAVKPQAVPVRPVVSAPPLPTLEPEPVTDDWLQAAREATP